MPSQDYKSLFIRHDRPYTGYLFTDLSIEKYRKKSMMKWGLQLGVLGPASQGQKMQEFIHQVFNLEENKGWEHQIQNQIGVNLEFWYLKSIFYGFNKQFDLNVFGGGQIGTIFNRADLGFVTRVGFGSLNPIYNSILLKSNLNKAPRDSSNNEVFLFIKPKLSYLLYDATISASLFNNDSSVSFASMPWQTSIEIGLNISQGRFDIAYSVFFLSKKPDNNLAASHEFGRLELIYRFN